jgi:putative ABC transport system substrate-binding protein
MGISKKSVIIITLLLLFIVIIGFFYIFSPVQTKPKRIGVLFYQNNLTTHQFLTGLKTGLAKQGYYQGKNLDLIVENFQNSTPKATLTTLQKIARQRVELLVTTGKDLTVTASRAFPDKPVIYTLVSRPVTEETIQTIFNGKNITGVSYFTPYDRTIELARRTIPNFKRLVLILPSESVWPDYNRLQEATQKAGIHLTRIVTPLSKLETTLLKLSGKTDAIFLPYDIQFIFRAALLKTVLTKAKLPAISNNLEYQSGCVLTYYAEPETIGEIAGRMAVKIFHGAKVQYLPVELSSYYKLTINLSMLKKLNFAVNEDVLSYANEVIR